MSIYGNGAGTVKKQVIVNPSLLPNFTTTNFALGVGGTMRLTEISSTNFRFPFDTYRGDVVVLQDFLSSGSIEVNSGTLSISTGTFFISETETVQVRSTNTIQPSLSTLSFNSTLFINHELQKVGINTQPYYTLDVHSVAYARSLVNTGLSSIIEGQIQVRQNFSTFWFATVTSGGAFSNVMWSADGETWSNFTDYQSGSNLVLCNIAFSGGEPVDGEEYTLKWIATGEVPFSGPAFLNLDTAETPNTASANLDIEGAIGTRTAITNIAYNGFLWVATCATTGGVATDSIVWSSNGVNWSNSLSGGLEAGGEAVAYNGSYWVAVGRFSGNPANTIVRSDDGFHWSNITSGGFTSNSGAAGIGGTAVLWTGCNWIATGEGFPTTSYLRSTDGLNWTEVTGYGFNNPKGAGYALGWNGKRLVAVGDAGTTPQSIQYSDDYGATWTVASGTLFEGSAERGLSVVWNGSYWLAGGIQGLRKSYDGITWFTPGVAPGINVSGLAWSSNAIPSMIVGSNVLTTLDPLNTSIYFRDQLRFYNNSVYPFQWSIDKTPYIHYTSSILDVNSFLQFNENNNVGTLPIATSYESSFVQTGTTLVSGFVSTNAVFYQGGYYLDIQNV
jgi:hypothetical protein